MASLGCVRRGKRSIPHKIIDDTVDLGALVAKSRRANSQGPKVLGGLGDDLLLETNGQILQKHRRVLSDPYTAVKPNDDCL